MLLDETCLVSKALKSQLAGKHNSLIICHEQYKPIDIYRTVLPLLQPNCSCVVFSIFMQPLKELQEILKAEKLSLRIKLEELLTREI